MNEVGGVRGWSHLVRGGGRGSSVPHLHTINHKILGGGERGAAIGGAVWLTSTVPSVKFSIQPHPTVLQLAPHTLCVRW